MAYDNTNRGALFKNDKKTGDSQPDYKGNLNVDGKEFYISAWLKTSGAGKKYMSLSVTTAETKGQSYSAKKAQEEGDDADVPF